MFYFVLPLSAKDLKLGLLLSFMMASRPLFGVIFGFAAAFGIVIILFQREGV